MECVQNFRNDIYSQSRMKMVTELFIFVLSGVYTHTCFVVLDCM